MTIEDRIIANYERRHMEDSDYIHKVEWQRDRWRIACVVMFAVALFFALGDFL